MKFIFLAILGLWLTPFAAVGQVTVKSACSRGAEQPANLVLTICKEEHGMTSFLQPQLYLRLYSDGRAEYEVVPPGPYGADQRVFVMQLKQFQVTLDEVEEIRALGRMPDFQSAPEFVPYYQFGMDVSIQKTIVLVDQGATKTIILGTDNPHDRDARKKFPSSLSLLLEQADLIREHGMGIVRPIPAITFCELIKNHEYYFGRTVSIYADLDLNGQLPFLNDPECDKPEMRDRRTKEKIAVGYLVKKGETTTALENQTNSIKGPRFGGRARVFITGKLRDETQRALDSFPYRFEISEFKAIEPSVTAFAGELNEGWMYFDNFTYLKEKGLPAAYSTRLKFLPHHAARVEFTNEANVPALRSSGIRDIVFRVLKKSTQKMTANRWNDLYTCEILELTVHDSR
ncbi:MAG: hypothetical protein ABIP75_04575 [Pyrinomonadaceae bacterium]